VCRGAAGAVRPRHHALRDQAGHHGTGSFGRSLWQTWDVLAALVSRGRLDLDALVTHRMGLPGFQQALDLQGGDAGKVLLIPTMN
jgi:threonine dehydrogenase-like Zn-dependent dehydrogenase